jgi:protoheme IX farnesyltransferase
MKAATTILSEAPPAVQARVADYLELVKPRISAMVLLTVATGVFLAGRGTVDWGILCHTLIGTALVAAGASALNQLLERDSDALMRRTESRPLPAGRLQPREVLIFGMVLGVGGVAYLAIALNHWLAAFVAAFTFLSYVFVYTPLKRKTSLNTLVGAVPGALPPVIGWAAVRGSLDREIVMLFGILFLWQVPHFLAIAWIYREDYRRAGLCMLPVLDREGSMSGRQMVAYCLALIPVSLAPLVYGGAGWIYLTGALGLGLGFLGFTVAFARQHSLARARGVLRASLLYLPALLALLLLDGVTRTP